MKNSLDHLAKAFDTWRSSPNKGRNTPDHLLLATAQLIDEVPSALLVKRLGISRAVLDRAHALKSDTHPNKPDQDPTPETEGFVALDLSAVAQAAPKPTRSSNCADIVSHRAMSMQLPIGSQSITVNGSAHQIAQVLAHLMRGEGI